MKHALLIALLLVEGCSEKVPLATQGQKCELDEQCSQGLICKCVRRRNPDDEGPDEILSPGFCTTLANFTKCPSDAGVTDTAFDSPPPVDSAIDVEPETSEASTDTSSEAAADAPDDGG